MLDAFGHSQIARQLWAGECEPLTESAERVISVVKVWMPGFYLGM